MEEFVNLVNSLSNSPDFIGTYKSTYFASGYGADGNKTYAYEDDVYTVGRDCGLLKAGDEVELDRNGGRITINGRTYTDSDVVADYMDDWTELSDATVKAVSSSEMSGLARRVSINVPVLDEDGNMTYDKETGNPVTEKALCTFDYLSQGSETITVLANGDKKTETARKVSAELREPVLGVSKATCYSIAIYNGEVPTTYVVELTRDGETSTYAYYTN